jgi:colanic acid/amylovoran biosynthesis protein
VTQEEYERSFATLCNSLIEVGYQILACSTCTGIEGYQKDDRMVAFKVGKLIKNPEMFKVVMDELNDVELGTLIGKCTLTIGTRLHSAIISMNFGTPAFALNYEHKSEGIMNQLGLPHFGVPISMLINGILIEKVRETLVNVDTIRQEVTIAVEKEKERARNMILSSLK